MDPEDRSLVKYGSSSKITNVGIDNRKQSGTRDVQKNSLAVVSLL
jgi:hypothetical protein